MTIPTEANDNMKRYTFWPDPAAEEAFNDSLDALRRRLSDSPGLAYSPELASISLSHVKSLALFYGANTTRVRNVSSVR